MKKEIKIQKRTYASVKYNIDLLKSMKASYTLEHSNYTTTIIYANGDKLKFLKLIDANPFKFDVISYITTLPKEFKLEQYIDYETQFEKTFLDPMRFILQSIGWEHEPTSNLEAFFS